jgi:hypothetical protein
MAVFKKFVSNRLSSIPPAISEKIMRELDPYNTQKTYYLYLKKMFRSSVIQ